MSGSRTSHFHSLVALLVGAAATTLVLGCQLTVPAPTPTPPATAHVFSFDAAEYSFNSPATLPSGVVTLRLSNGGLEPHHLQLLRLNDGVSYEQFAGALQQEGLAALRFVSLEGGAGAIGPHGSTEVTLNLPVGNYALACFVPGPDGAPHVARGMLKPIQVVGSETSPDAPRDAGTFTLRDFSFDMPATLPAGKATYKVVNAGPQLHELNVVKLAPGKVLEDVLAWDERPSGPPPFEPVGGMNGLSLDRVGYMTLDLASGDYVAICHIPDPASGVPHAHLGMAKAFSVR
jgi:hypothetical protein